MLILTNVLNPLYLLIPILLIPLIVLFVILINYKPADPNVSSLYANYQGTNEFELRIHQELRKTFKANEVFLNYMFGKGDKTTQIDHMVITRKAIFVLESKDYNGKVYADVHNQNWSQKLEYVKSTPSQYTSYSKYGKPYRKHYLKKHIDVHTLYNPVLQNEGHIKSVKFYLSDMNIPIVNIVVFSNRGNLVLKEYENKDLFIIHESDLQYIIKAYLDTRPKVISEKDLMYIENLLICLNTNSEQNALEHVNRLSKKLN
jgi:hypothetical protein